MKCTAPTPERNEHGFSRSLLTLGPSVAAISSIAKLYLGQLTVRSHPIRPDPAPAQPAAVLSEQALSVNHLPPNPDRPPSAGCCLLAKFWSADEAVLERTGKHVPHPTANGMYHALRPRFTFGRTLLLLLAYTVAIAIPTLLCGGIGRLYGMRSDNHTLGVITLDIVWFSLASLAVVLVRVASARFVTRWMSESK